MRMFSNLSNSTIPILLMWISKMNKNHYKLSFPYICMTRLLWCCWLIRYVLAFDMTEREFQVVAKVDLFLFKLWGRHVILIHVISWYPMFNSKLHLCSIMARKLHSIHAPMFIDQGASFMHLQFGGLMWECNLI